MGPWNPRSGPILGRCEAETGEHSEIPVAANLAYTTGGMEYKKQCFKQGGSGGSTVEVVHTCAKDT